MAKPQGAPAPIQAAYDAVSSAYNITSLNQGCFNQLGALFHAISKIAGEHTLLHDLAGIGSYLADDWANLNDCEHEALEPHFKALRAALYPNALPIGGRHD